MSVDVVSPAATNSVTPPGTTTSTLNSQPSGKERRKFIYIIHLYQGEEVFLCVDIRIHSFILYIYIR